MKILVLTTSYPTRDEPLPGIYVREHALAAAERADVVVLHLARGHRRGVTTTFEQGLCVCRVGYPERPLALSVAAHFAAAALGLRRLQLDGFVPDLVHAHFFLAALPAVLLTRSPVVTSEHWSIFLPEDPAQLSGAFLRVARFAYRHSCAVLPVSEALRDGLVAHGVRARFVVVPNAVDTCLFHPGNGRAESPPRLLTVSALNRGKGVDELLRAFDRVRGRVPGARLEIVGDGPERRALGSLVHELGLEGNVAFHGVRPKNEVAELMRSASLYVLASRFESNGVTVLEALASGLPVVGYGVPALRELVDEASGRLVAPGDVDGLADAIVTALASAQTYEAETIAATARARYSRDAVARSLHAVFEECLGI